MTTNTGREKRILGGLWGAVVGDALGVPVEFEPRSARKADPVTGMRGYGTYHQPKGTWSDDSSLLICTAESLVNGFDLHDMGGRFVRWYREGYWTPWGRTFDVGNTTQRAVTRLERGVDPEAAGDNEEEHNGNGSLMRILPAGLRFAHLPPDELLALAHRVSSLTHRHAWSRMACGFSCLMAAALLSGTPAKEAYTISAQQGLRTYVKPPHFTDLAPFLRYVSGTIDELPETQIGSGGFVVETLEASVWCLLTTSSFEEALLKAVNLGEDTDTTGCVTGGLAGICYGLDAIPPEWIETIPRREEIESVFRKLAALCGPGS
jgi:ADP-ribosylglycohydrolase